MGDGDELRRGREAYTARAWADVVDALTAADGQEALQPEDLELLATALFMVGREGDQFAALERAHQGHLDAAAPRRAARCAFWVGMQLIRRGDMGQGGGWIARAQRLVEHEDECAEHGYLLMPEIFRKEAMGDLEGAADVAARAVAIGRRFGDADLFALAAHTQGQLLVSAGRVDAGLRLMDEAMLAVTGGEVSPRPSGIVYCGSIVGCRLAFEPRRAREWTAALHTWCEAQPDMLAFTGDCHVHRAEIMDLHGDWSHALEELDRAAQRSLRAGNPRTAGQAAYRRGEILRRRGDLAAAEEAYRDAGRGGREPQPGLALLRLAQGDTGAALGAIRRVLDETSDPVQRAVLLPAAAEIMVAAGELDAARAAAAELGRIATERPSEMLAATAAHTVGAVELASGDAAAALRSLRRALEGWHDLGAPYEASRVRLRLADACRQVGDNDSAALELESAQESLAALGAAPGAPRDAHGLTRRELEVLRLVAAGATNKAIAAELVLSERTVDRHVSNILAKLRVPSRAAATAYAYEHRLL